jgi:hypothetical protein
VEAGRVVGQADPAVGEDPAEVIIGGHLIACCPGPADRFPGSRWRRGVRFLAGEQDPGAVRRAPLEAAPGQHAGPPHVPVPEGRLRQRGQRQRLGAGVLGFLGEDQRGAAVGRGHGQLAEIPGCPCQERAALRPGDIQVASVPQPLVFL